MLRIPCQKATPVIRWERAIILRAHYSGTLNWYSPLEFNATIYAVSFLGLLYTDKDTTLPTTGRKARRIIAQRVSRSKTHLKLRWLMQRYDNYSRYSTVNVSESLRP